MGKRGNQYRARATRRAGSEDMDFQDKQRVVTHMKSKGYSCRTNMFLLTHKDPELVRHVYVHDVTKQMLEQWNVAARPDVVCWKGNDDPLIIEVDGSYHKDFDFDSRYAELGISYLKINKEYMDKTGQSWESWIDAALSEPT